MSYIVDAAACTGAFTLTASTINNKYNYSSGSSVSPYGLFYFNAASSNSIYGDDNKVTPLSLSTKFFIKY